MTAQQVETVGSGSNKAKLVVSILIGAAGIFAYYWFAKYGALTQWASLIASIIVAAGIFISSESGQQLFAFAKDAVKEMKKVVWPARKETVQMTLYVFGFVVVMALFLWLSDKALTWLFYDMILGWKR
jgi:preprotein translocase subunit SecE